MYLCLDVYACISFSLFWTPIVSHSKSALVLSGGTKTYNLTANQSGRLDPDSQIGTNLPSILILSTNSGKSVGASLSAQS